MTPTPRKFDPIVYMAAIVFLTRERVISSSDGNHLVSEVRDAWRVQIRELCSRFELLTARERQVFELVTDGLPNKQVARQLEISEITVQIHRSRVMRKMSAPSFASLVRMADALQALCGPPQLNAQLRSLTPIEML